MDPSQTPQAAQTQPGILQAIEDAAKAAYENVKTRFTAGPPPGTLSAAPGSPLAQHDTAIQLIPRQSLSPQQSFTPVAQSPVSNPTLSHQQPPYGTQPQPPYGTNAPEQRLDSEGNVLGGLRGVKRAGGPNGGI